MSMIIKFLAFLYKILVCSERNASRQKAISHGMRVGKDTKFVGSQNIGSEPYLIRIGNNCLITNNVSFITHDGGIQVPIIKSGRNISEVYGKFSKFGRVTVGDNVFIGTGATLLPETTIGNNVLIAAGAVVKGEIPADVVMGGVPAKVICSIDAYYDKNKDDIFTLDDLDLSVEDKRTLVEAHLNKLEKQVNI